MAPHAARLTDNHTCPAHVGGPIVAPGMLTVLVETLPASRLADFAACAGPLDVLSTGAAMVLIGGLPATRVTDKTVHGGTVPGPGAAQVEIGGPTFALPANVTVGGPPDYQNKVIRDLYFLSTTPSGKELFSRLEATGKPVKIVPEGDPQNSFCTPNNATDAGNGTGTGSTVNYNPDARVNAYDRSGNPIAEPSQVLLGHEMCHALANAEGRQKSGTDPKPPPSQPDIEEEEAQAIGTGSHSADHPSENSFRRDLNLPERADHYWTPDGPDKALPPTSMRPGGY